MSTPSFTDVPFPAIAETGPDSKSADRPAHQVSAHPHLRPVPPPDSRSADSPADSAGSDSTVADSAGPDSGQPATKAPDHRGTSPARAERSSPPEPVRRLILTPASAVQMRPVFWSWADRIPAGAITIIPGREGIGKSLFLAWLSAHLTRGTLPGMHYGTPKAVIYAASEDSWGHTIAPRLAAAGADLDLVYRVDVDTDGLAGHLTLPTDCTGLAAEINRLDVALLAADPLLSLIHGSIDTHRDRDLRNALEPLATLADTTNCAVVGLAHFNKSATTDPLSLITGSRAFAAVARAVIAMAADPQTDDGTCLMTQAKSNLGRLDLPSLTYQIQTAEIPTPQGPAHVGQLTFTGTTTRTVTDILTDGATDPTEKTERNHAASWLADYLTHHGGEAPRADIIKASKTEGIAERTLQRAVTGSNFSVLRQGFPAVTLWRLNQS